MQILCSLTTLSVSFSNPEQKHINGLFCLNYHGSDHRKTDLLLHLIKGRIIGIIRFVCHSLILHLFKTIFRILLFNLRVKKKKKNVQSKENFNMPQLIISKFCIFQLWCNFQLKKLMSMCKSISGFKYAHQLLVFIIQLKG